MSAGATESTRYCVFVPARNVAHSIRRVLEGIPAAVHARVELILVIDNCSDDATVDEVRAFLEATPDSKVRLYQNDENYTLGGSTRLALELAMYAECDFVISMHGDGQADPADLPRFLDFATLDTDFVCGSRLLPASQVADYSIPRLLGNHALAWFQRVLFRIDVRDIAAYLAFNLHTVRTLPFREIESDMGYPAALILVAAMRRRLRCVEFPIAWGEIISSNVNPVVYLAQHVARLVRLRVLGERSILVPARAMSTRLLAAGTVGPLTPARFDSPA